MIAIITGGRDYHPTIEDQAWFEQLLLNITYPSGSRAVIRSIAVGDAKGVDAWAERWAKQKRIPCDVFKADWTTYGRSAGPKRNAHMLEFALLADEGVCCIAFPGGRGTKNMLDKAKQAAVPCYEHPARSGPLYCAPRVISLPRLQVNQAIT